MRPFLAALAVVAAATATPVAAQGVVGGLLGTVGGAVTTVTDTASEVTGSITGSDSGSETATPSSTARGGRSGAVMPVGTPTRSAGCQRVRFPGLPGDSFGVDKVQIRTLKTCVEPHVQSVAMVRQVPGIVAELEARGYDLDDLVTFEAKDDGLLLLYVYKRD